MSVHFGPQGPVVFLLMSAECGKRIRNILGMMEHCNGCYDPESDGKVKLVVCREVVTSRHVACGGMISTLDLRSKCREFDPQSRRYQWMGDCVQIFRLSQYITNHPGQLSLLSLYGR